MKFVCLIAVKDVTAARRFYEDVFGLTVTEDFGRMVGFGCGLVLQQDFHWLTGVSQEEMKDQENNCELVFELGEFDGLVQTVKQRRDITLLHDVKTHPWGQRVIRFYDLDNHLIEVGESMKTVVRRFLLKGLDMEQIADKMDVTIRDVKNMLEAEDC